MANISALMGLGQLGLGAASTGMNAIGGMLPLGMSMIDRIRFRLNPTLNATNAIGRNLFNQGMGSNPFGDGANTFGGILGRNNDGSPVTVGDAQAQFIRNQMGNNPAIPTIGNYAALAGAQRPQVQDASAGLAGLLGQPAAGTPNSSPRGGFLVGDLGAMTQSDFGGGAPPPSNLQNQLPPNLQQLIRGGVASGVDLASGAGAGLDTLTGLDFGGPTLGQRPPTQPGPTNVMPGGTPGGTPVFPPGSGNLTNIARPGGNMADSMGKAQIPGMPGGRQADPNMAAPGGNMAGSMGQGVSAPGMTMNNMAGLQSVPTTTGGNMPPLPGPGGPQPMAQQQPQQSLLQSIFANPESLNQQVQDDIFQQGREQVDVGTESMLRRIGQQNAASGFQNSGLQQKQGFDAELARLSELASGRRDIGIQAAQTNFNDRLNAGNLQLNAQNALANQIMQQNAFNQGLFDTDFQNQAGIINSVHGLQNQAIGQNLGLFDQLMNLSNNGFNFQQGLVNQLSAQQAARLSPTPAPFPGAVSSPSFNPSAFAPVSGGGGGGGMGPAIGNAAGLFASAAAPNFFNN